MRARIKGYSPAEVQVPLERISRDIKVLRGFAADSFDLQDILEHTIKKLYELQPNGKENYGLVNPKLGSVSLSRDYSEQGFIHLVHDINSMTAPLVYINLRKKSYSFEYNRHNQLIQDTERVMTALGLKKENQKHL